MFRLATSLAAVLLLSLTAASAQDAGYGVDCSFPIHSNEWKCGDLLGDRKKFYEDFMEGCRRKHGKKGWRCDETEADRLVMSLRQPQSMVNYTSTGFKKIKAPKAVFDLLINHWERNNQFETEEVWTVGNTYTNNWEAPTYMTSVENQKLRGGGYQLKNDIWNAAKTTIEEWTGMEQKPISMYGIRKYTRGAVLNPHVDRNPLVSSAIVNVAQDVDEPWPLEVYDREGKAVNVTMEPGDMVLYESGSLIHGRPFPLKGEFYANIFIHFEPTGRPLGDHTDKYLETLDSFYPPYLVPDSLWTKDWAARNPGGWHKPSPSAPIQQISSPEAHHAAATGDIDRIAMVAKKDKKALKQKDQNGWQPIHEAARAGHTDIVKVLLEHGADKDARTGRRGEGSSPLSIALEYLGADHEIISFFRSVGAQEYSQEL